MLLSAEERESRLCDTCCDWQGVVRMAQPAISYATREASRDKAERIAHWRKRQDRPTASSGRTDRAREP